MAGLEEMFHDGHYTVHRETFPNFVNHLPPPLVRYHTFHCRVQCPVFMYRVTFLRSSHDGGVDVEIWLRRADDIPISVDVEFGLSAVSSVEGVEMPSIRLTWNGMGPISRTSQPLMTFMPIHIATQVGDGDVEIECILGIHGCHGERDTGGSSRKRSPPRPPLLQELWHL